MTGPFSARPLKLSGKRIAVTGASGFIGEVLCRRLVAEDARVRGLDLASASGRRVEDAGAEFVAADVTSPPALAAGLEGCELVVHTAAVVSDWGPMDQFVRVNVGGTANVISAARAVGTKRLVHVSSVVVYGYDSTEELDEDAPRRSCGIPYIDTKSASDRIACDGGCVVVRPGDVYGPGSVWTVRPVEAIKAGTLALVDGGSGIMLPVYVDDLVEAIVAALERGKPGRAYTAWSGEDLTFGEYFNRYALMLGKGELRGVARPVATGTALGMEALAKLTGKPRLPTRNGLVLISRRARVSNLRIREELGWEPRVMLDEGMRRTEEWLRTEGLL